MTQPRQILPGTTYFVTRRCAEQRFFLKPSPLTIQIFSFCVGMAAKLHNIEIHAACTMSNHWHAVLTDTDGNLCSPGRSRYASFTVREVTAGF